MGVPRVIYELSEGLANSGITSQVLALYENSNDEPLQIGNHQVHRVERNLHVASTSLSYSILGKFRKLAKKADIVHYHFPWPMADVLYYLHGRAKPSVVTYHSDIIRQRNLLRFYKPIMNRFLSAADAVVATSPNYAKTSPVLLNHSDNLSIIPVGIGEKTDPDKALVDKWRGQVGDNFFLFVGALRYYKGIPYLLEAARQTGIPLVIVGGADSLEISPANLPQNATMVGAVSDDDKEALLSLCRGLILPSHLRSEAFGIALLEAARAGKPMISCEIGTGTSFVNKHEETGYYRTTLGWCT
ncbi:MAG: glycosyltransferase [Pseudomonadota bacterium]